MNSFEIAPRARTTRGLLILLLAAGVQAKKTGMRKAVPYPEEYLEARRLQDEALEARRRNASTLEARRVQSRVVEVTTTTPAGGVSQADVFDFFAPPLCGLSKRPLDADPVRRTCLRQCFLDEGYVRPTFTEWETFCRETAHMGDWDEECKGYMCCTYGCAVYGGDRDVCRNSAGGARYELFQSTNADMYSAGITQEKRCELEKCHAFCAREAFGTCRETQYRAKCMGSNPHLYGCDVDCNMASRQGGLLVSLLSICLAALTAAIAR